MTKTRKLITIFACILLALYALVACLWSISSANAELCAGLAGGEVEVIDPFSTGFVTSKQITEEIGPLLGDLKKRRLSSIPLDSIRRHLESLDKIESAQVMVLNNNTLSIRVVPMVPVARVWPENGSSNGYYVNRAGKKIAASQKYRVDVPQLTGNFTEDFTPTSLLPLFDYLDSNQDINKLITFINAKDSTDVFLVPAIRGHIINLGDINNLDNKFTRLTRFYTEVLPQKGWEFYDTISLKWDGQIVATRRNGKLPSLAIELIDELEHDDVDPESVTTNLTGEQTKQTP